MRPAKIWGLGVLVVLVVILGIGNPGPSTYSKKVTQYLLANQSSGLVKGIGGLFSSTIASYIEANTIRDNFILFSFYHTVTPFGDGRFLAIAWNVIPLSVKSIANPPSIRQSGINLNNTQQSSGASHPAYCKEPTFASFDHDQKGLKMIDAGNVTITGKDGSVVLPVVAISGSYGIPGESKSIVPAAPIGPIKFNIPPAQADDLSIYYLDKGAIFLGPRGWKAINAGVGADGSMGITLVPNGDTNSAEGMSLSNDGGCQGCGIDAIGQWVPGLRAWAANQDAAFGYCPFLYPIKYVAYGKHAEGFSYAGDRSDTINGVVYYRLHGPAGVFFSIEYISLPESQHQLATTILNFFLDHTRVQWGE